VAAFSVAGQVLLPVADSPVVVHVQLSIRSHPDVESVGLELSNRLSPIAAPSILRLKSERILSTFRPLRLVRFPHISV
jgi:hypothetical protein